MTYICYETDEYKNWLDSLTLKSRRQIQSRTSKIETDGYFGDCKYLGVGNLWELKWTDGRRVYYVIINKTNVILLIGGNKNGQDKDIKQASNILRKLGS